MDKANLSQATFSRAWESLFTLERNKAFESKLRQVCDAFLQNKSITSAGNISQLVEQFTDVEIPDLGRDIMDFSRELETLIVANSVNAGATHYIGHMAPKLPNFIPPLAELLTCLNQNQVKTETAKSTTLYERQALCMLHKLFYKEPEHFYQASLRDANSNLGVMNSGGTVSNLIALECARDASLSEYGDVENEGLAGILKKGGFDKSVIICSTLGHYSLKKSMGILGLGRENIVTVGLDRNQCMDVDALEKVIDKCHKNNWHIVSIVAVAGSTECGSFDDLVAISKVCKEHAIHLHVDGSWGGALIFSDKHSSFLKGIEHADTIALDGHKQLYLPLGVGFTLFKSATTSRYLKMEANYIIRKNSYDLGRISIEGSRPAMVIYLQAALQLLGKKGYGEIIDTTIKTAQRMADYIDSCSDFELLSSPQSNIFLYRYIPPAFQQKKSFTPLDNIKLNHVNIRLQEAQSEAGKSFVSRTELDLGGAGATVGLRVVILNPLCNFVHCLEVLNDQRRLSQEFENLNDLECS